MTKKALLINREYEVNSTKEWKLIISLLLAPSVTFTVILCSRSGANIGFCNHYFYELKKRTIHLTKYKYNNHIKSILHFAETKTNC